MSIRLVVFGSGGFGLKSFERIRCEKRFEIVAVVTQPPRPIGRHQRIEPTVIGQWAAEHHLLTMTPERLRQNDECFTRLSELRPDLTLVADYGLIVPSRFLSLAPHGAMNIHGSLLPRWRGAAPIVHALIAGDSTTGVTFMQMDPGLDTGPVYRQFSVPISPTETAVELEQRLSSLAADQVTTVIADLIEHHLQPQPQPASGVTLAPKIHTDDGRATWQSATAEERKIRALSPWPGLWTSWKHWRIKILAAVAEPGNDPNHVPGTVVADGQGWYIACDEGRLRPSRLHVSGRQPQEATMIPGGYPGFIGARLGT